MCDEEESETVEVVEEPANREAIYSLKENKQTIKGVLCTECGACCCPPGEKEHPYVELLHADMVRLGVYGKRFIARKQGATENTSGFFLKALPPTNPQFNGRNNLRCPFFNGEVGQRCECGIYELRPRACREHLPGDHFCLQLRAQHPGTNPRLAKHYRDKLGKEPRLFVLDEGGKPIDVTGDEKWADRAHSHVDWRSD